MIIVIFSLHFNDLFVSLDFIIHFLILTYGAHPWTKSSTSHYSKSNVIWNEWFTFLQSYLPNMLVTYNFEINGFNLGFFIKLTNGQRPNVKFSPSNFIFTFSLWIIFVYNSSTLTKIRSFKIHCFKYFNNNFFILNEWNNYIPIISEAATHNFSLLFE